MVTMTDLLKEFWINKGKQMQLNVNGLMVNVVVTDLRQVWNRLDAKVTPVSGNGELWVEARRLTQPV
jgi:hypothetical protein